MHETLDTIEGNGEKITKAESEELNNDHFYCIGIVKGSYEKKGRKPKLFLFPSLLYIYSPLSKSSDFMLLNVDLRLQCANISELSFFQTKCAHWLEQERCHSVSSC